MMPLAIVNFARMSDESLIAKGKHILKCITGNPNFPNPVPALETVDTAVKKFEESFILAKSGGKDDTALKNQDRKILEAYLKKLGLYVQLNCNDDLAILLSSGFDAKKDSQPVGPLGKPENLKVINGPNRGEVTLSVDPLKGADVYIYEYAPAPLTPETVWKTIIGKRIVVLNGFTLGKEYIFRATGKGASDTMNYSDIISRFIS